MKIALATMVKNESDVIVRMLDSVRLLVDRVIMLDTGSTDDTIAKARAWCKGYGTPFELMEHPFDNFGESRTRLLTFAKGKADWIFMLDADWTLKLSTEIYNTEDNWGAIKCQLDPKNASYSLLHGDIVEYWQPHFIRGDQDWEYVGVCHEYLKRSEVSTQIHGLTVVDHPCSPEDRKARTFRNLSLLHMEFAKDPKNSRTVFYIARTYSQLGMRALARSWFRMRVDMGGWDEETFIALCEIAYAGVPSDPKEFWEAWAFRPTRAEPLFWLARAYKLRGAMDKAKQVDAIRRGILIPDDILFVDTAAYGPDVDPTK